MCILKITHDSFFLNLTDSNFPAHAGATLGDNYDQRLNHVNLPSALQTLTFGEAFNRRLDDVVFPSSLKTLTFGDCFNQSLKDVNFPKSLRHLSFGFNFNQSLQISWPKNLQTLTLDYMFNQSLDDVNLPCPLDLFSWCFFSFSFLFTMVNHQFSPPFERISRWWQLKYFFIFTPKIWGRWTQFDGAHIFQMGWFNHQLNTLPKTNIAPENGWLECIGMLVSLLGWPIFRCYVSFREGIFLTFFQASRASKPSRSSSKFDLGL